MCHVAGMYRQDSLRGISMDELLTHCNEIREDCGDRAFLRAMHFVSENDRVKKQLASLKQNDFDSFLELVRMSGDSSFKCLQNVYSTQDPAKQPLAVALAVSEAVLGDDGVCRVHGGGFAGTIQAFVKTPAVDRYCKAIDRLFGEGSCKPIRISPVGCVQIL